MPSCRGVISPVFSAFPRLYNSGARCLKRPFRLTAAARRPYWRIRRCGLWHPVGHGPAYVTAMPVTFSTVRPAISGVARKTSVHHTIVQAHLRAFAGAGQERHTACCPLESQHGFVVCGAKEPCASASGCHRGGSFPDASHPTGPMLKAPHSGPPRRGGWAEVAGPSPSCLFPCCSGSRPAWPTSQFTIFTHRCPTDSWHGPSAPGSFALCARQELS